MRSLLLNTLADLVLESEEYLSLVSNIPSVLGDFLVTILDGNGAVDKRDPLK